MDDPALILVAAGRGVRFGGDRPKPLVELEGRPLLVRALSVLRRLVRCAVVVAPPGEEPAFAEALRRAGEPVPVVAGGTRRQDSVENGLRALPPSFRWILVHDAARPLVDVATAAAVLEAARAHGAAIPVVRVDSTVKEVDAAGRVTRTVPREDLRLVQTPQAFRRDLLEKAFALAASEGETFTDEAGMLEHAGIEVMTVPGAPFNVKITTPSDLAWARTWLRADAAGNA